MTDLTAPTAKRRDSHPIVFCIVCAVIARLSRGTTAPHRLSSFLLTFSFIPITETPGLPAPTVTPVPTPSPPAPSI